MKKFSTTRSLWPSRSRLDRPALAAEPRRPQLPDNAPVYFGGRSTTDTSSSTSAVHRGAFAGDNISQASHTMTAASLGGVQGGPTISSHRTGCSVSKAGTPGSATTTTPSHSPASVLVYLQQQPARHRSATARAGYTWGLGPSRRIGGYPGPTPTTRLSVAGAPMAFTSTTAT